MKDPLVPIAAQLKAARLQKKWSQRMLSAKTKIPQTHISKIENAEVDLQTSSLIELARALDLELMLIPKSFVLMFRTLMKPEDTEIQRPKYSLYLDHEEEEENA